MELVGFAKISNDRKHLRLNIGVNDFEKAQKTSSPTGGEYVSLHVSIAKAKDVLSGERGFTSITTMPEGVE